MRREGYELAVSRPQVIIKEVNGEKQEPYEMLTVDVESQHQGVVMEKLGLRKGDLLNMEPDGKGRVRLEYMIPSRGLINRSQFGLRAATRPHEAGIASNQHQLWRGEYVLESFSPSQLGEPGVGKSPDLSGLAWTSVTWAVVTSAPVGEPVGG